MYLFISLFIYFYDFFYYIRDYLILREDVVLYASRAWDKEKHLRPQRESNSWP